MPRPACNAVTGRPFWAMVGRCCCGGVTPCECVDGPGCVPAGYPVFHAVKTDPNTTTLIYLYGPVPTDCCCRPPLGMTRTYTALFEDLATTNEPYGRVTCRVLAEGSGTDGQVTVRTRYWSEVTLGGGLQLISDETQTLSIPLCIPHFIVLPVSPGCGQSGLGGLGTVGSLRQTCSSYEANVLDYFPDPISGTLNRLGRRAVVRVALVADRENCISPSCRTCCLPDATCILATPAACLAAGGTPGTGTDCTAVNCPQAIGPQACCKPDGSCEDLLPFRCLRLGGTPQGQFTTCANTFCPPPPVRACCLPSGICLDMTAAECAAQGGSWYAAQLCAAVNCTNLGACCHPDGQCSIETQGLCLSINGVWHAGQTCAQVVCPPCLGACCSGFGPSYGCTIQTRADCEELFNPRWNGCGTTCTPDPCIGPEGLWTPPRGIVVPEPPCTGCGAAAKVIQPWT